MKSEMTSVDVAAIVSELNTDTMTLIDAKIGKIYQTGDDEIRITLNIYQQGRHHLVIQAGKRIHFTQYPRPAPKLPAPFPMLLRKHIISGRITQIFQYDFDRIIEITIIRAGIVTKLIIELFARGNIMLADTQGRIIQPLKPVSFKDRKLRRGEIYELPPPQLSPLDISVGALEPIFNESKSDIVRTIATRLNIGGVLAEEVCLRAGIDKHITASEVSDLESLHVAINEVFNPIKKGELDPQIVIKEGKNIDVIPFGLQQYQNLDILQFKSFSQALDEYFNEGVKPAAPHEIAIEKKENMLERRLRQQHDAIEKFTKQQAKLKAKGELLYAHYQTVEEILKIINDARQRFSWDEIKHRLKNADNPQAKLIRSIDPSTGTLGLVLDEVHIDVNINLTVPRNAQIFYDKAKKTAKKRSGALNAITITQDLIKKRDKNHDKDHLSGKRGKVKVKPRWYDRFKWFESSDGFLVVGGRDVSTNEDVVRKYMEKRDVFFHTESPGSPAVVIKTQGKQVPQTTLKESAEFVISNSSVWKSDRIEGDCYWVMPDQVSKTPEPGEFLPRGSFVIRGKRNFIKTTVNAAVGIQTKGNIRLVGGPTSAVSKLAEYMIEVEQGEFNQSDIAKKIYKLFVDKVGDRQFVKSIASPDKIAMMLPPGNSGIKHQ
ncbi:MAG: ribosome rescue protein RqcH [Methanosarcinales archaeon]